MSKWQIAEALFSQDGRISYTNKAGETTTGIIQSVTRESGNGMDFIVCILLDANNKVYHYVRVS